MFTWRRKLVLSIIINKYELNARMDPFFIIINCQLLISNKQQVLSSLIIVIRLFRIKFYERLRNVIVILNKSLLVSFATEDGIDKNFKKIYVVRSFILKQYNYVAWCFEEFFYLDSLVEHIKQPSILIEIARSIRMPI